jgi:hypothetical protein
MMDKENYFLLTKLDIYLYVTINGSIPLLEDY